MSTKDTSVYRDCPICGDRLPGSDDGAMVFECLKEGVEAINKGTGTAKDLGCTLCGEEVAEAEAREIVAKGEPAMQDAEDDEEDD